MVTLFDDRTECACNAVRFFAILSMQRSGSGWFETLLNSHPNVSSNGEIFSVKSRRNNVSAVLSTLDKVYNLDWLSSASKNECSAAVGFKWMFNQVGEKRNLFLVYFFLAVEGLIEDKCRIPIQVVQIPH